jgi:hypothetical protein
VTAAREDQKLDVITIGRASVDLYGQQIGTRLEDVDSFAKSVGGCPTNIAVGTARLGLKAALITRVGNEQMGRFIREQLAREKVETRGIATDPDRWFRPPYVGHNGWVGTWLNVTTDWPEVEGLIEDAWRLTASKTQIRAYDAKIPT